MGLLRRKSFEKVSLIFPQVGNFLPFILIFGLWGLMIFPSSLYPYWIYLDIPFVMKKSGFAPLFHLLRPDGASGRFIPVKSGCGRMR